jgi:hypothetical protein
MVVLCEVSAEELAQVKGGVYLKYTFYDYPRNAGGGQLPIEQFSLNF